MGNASGTAVYVRISEDRLGLELGIDRQRAECRELCGRRGWSDPIEFADNDLTASTGAHRPGYAALVAAIERGQVARVVVWHPSRIWRNRRERAEGIELFKRHRVTLACVKGPELDLSNAYGRLAADLVGAFDSAEGEVKAERVVSKIKEKAEAGQLNGSGAQNRLFGYTDDGQTVVQEEAEQVRAWFCRFLAGQSVASLAREAGVSTTGMRRRLHNARYAAFRHTPTPDATLPSDPYGLGRGIRQYAGSEYPAAWPAIVDRATWEAACRILDDPARITNGGRSERKWLGSGLYICERCQRKVYSSYGKGTHHVYKCRPELGGGCSRTWSREVIDIYVEALVRERLGRGDLADLLPRDRPDLARLEQEAAGIRSRLRTLGTDFVLLGMDAGQLRDANESGRARLAAIERQLGDPGRAGVLGELLAHHDPVKLWDSIPDDQVSRRQAIVRATMTITLGPAPRGNRGRASFEDWTAQYGDHAVDVGPPIG